MQKVAIITSAVLRTVIPFLRSALKFSALLMTIRAPSISKTVIGGFDAEFLIDFFSEEMAAFFYNKGLYDAEVAISAKLADISDA